MTAEPPGQNLVRLAARTVDLGLHPGRRAAEQGRNVPMTESAAEILSTPRPAEPAKRPAIKAVPASGPAAPVPDAALLDALSESIVKAQDTARQTALQLADAGLDRARAMIDLQETVLRMAQANLAASFASAQRILASTTLNEAIAHHQRFAQEQVAALIGQASELRRFASRATGDSAEPWAQYWTRHFTRIRETFGA